MSKNHQSPSRTQLRAIADDAVATWRDLAEKASALRTETESFFRQYPLPVGTYDRGRMVRPTVVLLDHLQRSIALTEADGRAAVAERDAAIALDAAELAELAEGARMRHLPTLREDIVDLSAEIDTAQAALKAAQGRRLERVQSALRAEAAAGSRRQAAGLPWASAGFAPQPANQTFLAAVDEALERGFRLPGHAAAAADLRVELRNAAAALEEARLEKEAQKVHDEKWRLNEQRLAEQDWARERAKAKAQRDEVEAEQRRRDELANAHLARLSAGAR